MNSSSTTDQPTTYTDIYAHRYRQTHADKHRQTDRRLLFCTDRNVEYTVGQKISQIFPDTILSNIGHFKNYFTGTFTQ